MKKDSPGRKSAPDRKSKSRPPIKTGDNRKNQRVEQKHISAQTRRDSELRYRRLFETAQDGILILDAQTGAIDDVNPFLIDMLGYSRAEFVKKKLWEVGAFKDMEASKVAFQTLQKNEYIRYEDLPLRAKSGKLLQVEFVSNMYLVGAQKVIQCNIRDITDRVKAEQFLQLHDRRFQALIENATDALTLLDLQGNVIYDNPTLPGMLGYGPEDRIGKKIFEIIHPDDLQKSQDMFQQVLNTPGRRADETFRMRHKNGSWIWIEGSATNLLEEPAVNAIILNYRDITERKQAEEALRAGEARYRGLFEDSPISLWEEDFSAVKRLLDTLRAEGVTDFREYFSSHSEVVTECATLIKILDVNKATMHLFGASRKEDMLQSLDVLFEGEPSFAFRDQLIAIAEGKTRLAWEGINKTLDGRLLNIQLVWSAVSGYEESLSRVNVSMTDVTERKAAEARIKRQVHRLSALQAIDSAILSSFDLRLSLNILLAQTINELQVDAAAVFLLNNGSNELVYASGAGFRGRDIAGLRKKPGEGYAGQAILERRTIVVPDLAQSVIPYPSPRLIGDEKFVAFFAVPLVAKGHVKGVLELFHRSRLDPEPEWLDFMETLAGRHAIAIDSIQTFTDLQRSNIDLSLAYDATIEGWSQAMDLRDKETEGHTRRVTETAVRLSRAMGLSEGELVQVRRGAMLHDIGKIGVPDAILHKPGPLTEDEWTLMRLHPTRAYEMLANIRYLEPAINIPYCHHEKWDGTGYPRGLKGEQIPFTARIFAVVDVWDAITSDRPYRPAWSHEKAIEYIRSQVGSHFDPAVVKVWFDSGMFDGETQT